MWGLPLWLDRREPKLMGHLLPLCKGVASSLVFSISLCIQPVITVLLHLFFFFPFFFGHSFTSKTHVMAVVPKHCCRACLSWCGSGSSGAIYWLRSWSKPVLLLKGTGCSCLSHSQTFPFLLLPWLLPSHGESSPLICCGKNKATLVSIGMAELIQVPPRSPAAASWPEVQKFVTLFRWRCDVRLVSLAGDQIVSPSSSVPSLVWLWHSSTLLWLGFFPVQQEFIWGLAVYIVLVVLCEHLPSFSFYFLVTRVIIQSQRRCFLFVSIK